jgi:aspartate/methionine/tyrosine aminotransferase
VVWHIEALTASRVDKLPMWPFTAVGRRARQIDAPKLALGQGQPDFDTPQHIKDAMNEALRMGYTGYGGVPELVNFLVKKFKEDNNIDKSDHNTELVCASVNDLIRIIHQEASNCGEK